MSDLLAWYDRHRRDLPWRRDRDPYRVWVSEIMLQQTRVETVIPYYQRFLDRFPNVEALAAADLEEVLANWSGLGYYRRARQMHRAAEEISAAGGRFPKTLKGLRELPGIGAYTAAAVGSIAFGLEVAVLDGNVERLTARLMAYDGDPKRSEGRRILEAKAAALLVPGRPGDSNQALMELGATICTPKTPSCLLCPLEGECQARQGGEPENFPRPRTKRTALKVRLAVAVVRRREAVLLFRRPEGIRLLAGTWELPWAEIPARAGKLPVGASVTIERALAERYGGAWTLGEHHGRVRHSITYRSIEAEVFEARHEGSGEVAESGETIAFTAAGHFAPDERRDLPLSSLVEKALAVLG